MIFECMTQYSSISQHKLSCYCYDMCACMLFKKIDIISIIGQEIYNISELIQQNDFGERLIVVFLTFSGRCLKFN